MSAIPTRSHPQARWRRSAFALTIAFGIVAGWVLLPAQTRTFDEIYAVLSPLGLAALCVAVLLQRAKHAWWVVCLLLVLLVASVLARPPLLVMKLFE